ncbi:hypothetical protein P4O66_003166 [Electrophorus voltai]|uniref:Uncharacterized protein n=1 Tax=Electrophorus voltai TaxID=2609070 RepID=A0AAD8YU58_9TELE|nr:hypothetical protein P4O66_003166 [Electrophorus voltai]
MSIPPTVSVHDAVLGWQVECKKAQPKEVMFPPGTRGRARGLPYTMDAFMLGMGMLRDGECLTGLNESSPPVPGLSSCPSPRFVCFWGGGGECVQTARPPTCRLRASRAYPRRSGVLRWLPS